MSIERVRRDAYQAALTTLDAARAQMRRADLMTQIALNRVRQAEEEGFDEEATRREARRAELEAAHQVEVAAVAALAASVEELRQSAVGEEIDEVAVAFDATLLTLLDLLERLRETHTALARLAERTERLAATLPATARPPQQIATAEVLQVRALLRAVETLRDATVSQPLSVGKQDQ